MVMAHRLTVLSSTATAHAECAWVLWQESSAVGYAVSWTQSGAWSAESECRSQRAKALSLLGVTAQVSEGSRWATRASDRPPTPTGTYSLSGTSQQRQD